MVDTTCHSPTASHTRPTSLPDGEETSGHPHTRMLYSCGAMTLMYIRTASLRNADVADTTRGGHKPIGVSDFVSVAGSTPCPAATTSAQYNKQQSTTKVLSRTNHGDAHNTQSRNIVHTPKCDGWQRVPPHVPCCLDRPLRWCFNVKLPLPASSNPSDIGSRSRGRYSP